MNTPCQENPEAWVGNDTELRAEAVKACLTCPVFDACHDGKFGTPGPDDHGVWAGVEYIDGHPTRRVLKPCATCGLPVSRSRSKFCSPRCYHASNVKECGPLQKSCAVCGDDFIRGERSVKQWKSARFCSNACAGKSRRKVAA